MQLSKISLFLMWFIIPYAGHAQESDPTMLTLERIYTLEEFEADDIKDLRWIEDGTFYSRLEDSKDYPGAKDIVLYNTDTGKRNIFVSAEDLNSSCDKTIK